VAFAAGQALAGTLVSWAGAPAVFILTAATMVATLLLTGAALAMGASFRHGLDLLCPGRNIGLT
jgi:hypothetical protein